ncbi:MAG: hypothetical protein N2578_00750 [Bdellovibrionaceae bacterium]|nr:hypothetical protein [Pseudobdellovibrionaceae bacterium]
MKLIDLLTNKRLDKFALLDKLNKVALFGNDAIYSSTGDGFYSTDREKLTRLIREMYEGQYSQEEIEFAVSVLLDQGSPNRYLWITKDDPETLEYWRNAAGDVLETMRAYKRTSDIRRVADKGLQWAFSGLINWFDRYTQPDIKKFTLDAAREAMMLAEKAVNDLISKNPKASPFEVWATIERVTEEHMSQERPKIWERRVPIEANSETFLNLAKEGTWFAIGEAENYLLNNIGDCVSYEAGKRLFEREKENIRKVVTGVIESFANRGGLTTLREVWDAMDDAAIAYIKRKMQSELCNRARIGGTRDTPTEIYAD